MIGRGFVGVVAAVAMGFGTAHAQDMGSWFPMPDPIDVIGVQGLGDEGECGSSIGKNSVADEVQRLYAREGRCAEYDGSKLYNPYKSWIRGHDPDAKVFSGNRAGEYEVLGDYETVSNYFYYHGLGWWDGAHTQGYRETAPKAGQPRKIQRTSRFARFGYKEAPSETRGFQPQVGASLDATRGVRTDPPASAPDVGACGTVPSDDVEAKLQDLFDQRGMCARYHADDYAQFKSEVPPEQHYVVNYMAWYQDRPLYSAEEARLMDATL